MSYPSVGASHDTHIWTWGISCTAGSHWSYERFILLRPRAWHDGQSPPFLARWGIVRLFRGCKLRLAVIWKRRAKYIGTVVFSYYMWYWYQNAVNFWLGLLLECYLRATGAWTVSVVGWWSRHGTGRVAYFRRGWNGFPAQLGAPLCYLENLIWTVRKHFFGWRKRNRKSLLHACDTNHASTTEFSAISSEFTRSKPRWQLRHDFLQYFAKGPYLKLPFFFKFPKDAGTNNP